MRFAGSEAAVPEFICGFVVGLYAEIICLGYMGSVSNAYRKSAPCFDILHCFVRLRQIEGDIAPFLHGAPCSVHDINAAVFIVSCYHTQARCGSSELLFLFLQFPVSYNLA